MVSYSKITKQSKTQTKVLILIVVEDGLVRTTATHKDLLMCVLILIVVEDGLVRITAALNALQERGVLILIVVEDGLVQMTAESLKKQLTVLILIVVEDGLVLDLIRLF